MPGGGNRQLRIRLPSDHWVWRIEDPVARRREVERALEFYTACAGRLEELRLAVEEIRQAVREGRAAAEGRVAAATPPGKPRGQGDERLFAALDKFLEV